MSSKNTLKTIRNKDCGAIQRFYRSDKWKIARAMHCIYVISEGYDYGILIESEGYDYPRYTSYLPVELLKLK